MNIDLDYIQHLAEGHEGVDVEFKETTGQLDRGMETLCGMLNGTGGIVIFGIKKFRQDHRAGNWRQDNTYDRRGPVPLRAFR